MDYVLCEADRAAIAELLRKNGIATLNTRQRYIPEQPNLGAPEVYVAQAPPAGIPGFKVRPGTAGPGTEGGTDLFGQQCGIWKIIPIGHFGTGTGSSLLSEYGLIPVRFLTKTVFNLSPNAVAGNAWFLAIRDKFGYWFVSSVPGGGGETAILAKLVAKTYGGGFRAYSWVEVIDSNSPPVTYTDDPFVDPLSGGPCAWQWSKIGTAVSLQWVKIGGACLGGCSCDAPLLVGNYEGEVITTHCPNTCNGPAYHEQDVDLVVPCIVRLRKGSGNYWLIDQMNRIEFVRNTGDTVTIDGVTYMTGFLERYDQVTQRLVDEGTVLILDLNA